MNLVQCHGSLQENKRKRKRVEPEFDYIYGIVTTGTKWWYVMFTNETKKIYTTANAYADTIPLEKEALHDDSELKRTVKKAVATIAWMLQDRAGVGEDSLAKKRRVEENT